MYCIEMLPFIEVPILDVVVAVEIERGRVIITINIYPYFEVYYITIITSK